MASGAAPSSIGLLLARGSHLFAREISHGCLHSLWSTARAFRRVKLHALAAFWLGPFEASVSLYASSQSVGVHRALGGSLCNQRSSFCDLCTPTTARRLPQRYIEDAFCTCSSLHCRARARAQRPPHAAAATGRRAGERGASAAATSCRRSAPRASCHCKRLPRARRHRRAAPVSWSRPRLAAKRRIIVTGANSGVGLEGAKILAKAGHERAKPRAGTRPGPTAAAQATGGTGRLRSR